MKKGELILLPFSYRVSFKEDKPVSEKVAETNKFYIVSRTENEMILGADCRDCYVIIYFRKK